MSMISFVGATERSIGAIEDVREGGRPRVVLGGWLRKAHLHVGIVLVTWAMIIGLHLAMVGIRYLSEARESLRNSSTPLDHNGSDPEHIWATALNAVVVALICWVIVGLFLWLPDSSTRS